MYKDWYRYGLRRERERVPDLKTGLKLPPPNDVRTNGAERKLVINRRPEKIYIDLQILYSNYFNSNLYPLTGQPVDIHDPVTHAPAHSRRLS